MQRLLMAVLMALVLTLAVVGFKRVAQGQNVGESKVLIADGGAPSAPIPW